MQKFNLKKALAGDPVITRNGRRILRIAYFPECGEYDKVVAAIEGEGEIFTFYEDGSFVRDGLGIENENDLFMAPKKVKYYFCSCPSSKDIRVLSNMYKTMEELKLKNDLSRPGLLVHEIEIEE